MPNSFGPSEGWQQEWEENSGFISRPPWVRSPSGEFCPDIWDTWSRLRRAWPAAECRAWLETRRGICWYRADDAGLRLSVERSPRSFRTEKVGTGYIDRRLRRRRPLHKLKLPHQHRLQPPAVFRPRRRQTFAPSPSPCLQQIREGTLGRLQAGTVGAIARAPLE